MRRRHCIVKRLLTGRYVIRVVEGGSWDQKSLYEIKFQLNNIVLTIRLWAINVVIDDSREKKKKKKKGRSPAWAFHSKIKLWLRPW